MLALSRETEALAQRLADAEKLSVDAVVRGALQSRAQEEGVFMAAEPNDAADRAERRSKVLEILRQIDALPDVDPRSAEEIMQDLNEL